MDGVPVEILCRALRAVFVSPYSVDASLPVQRDVLCSVCRLWRAAIDNDARSWANIFITYSTRVDSLREWLLRARNVPLAIDIHFPNTLAPLEVQRLPELFSELVPFVHRCRRLRIRVANNRIGTYAFGLIAALPMDSLSTVDIVMAPPYQSPRFATFAHSVPPVLTTLSFHRAFPTWMDKSSFACITSLTLSNITTFPRPFVGDIADLFGATPNLVHLVLYYVDPHIIGVRQAASTRVTLDRLEHLEFAMRRARCTEFLSVLWAPNLERLAVTLDREEDVLPCLELCGRRFSTVFSLRLACHFTSHTVLTTVLADFNALVQLDARRSPGFPLAFYGAALHSERLCPNLFRVCAGDLPALLVEDILRERNQSNFASELRICADVVSADVYAAPAYAEYGLSGGRVLCRGAFVDHLF
ncbi:hypothetical protein R3P38DRAFT_3224386 [Favolaschia claudopus]|uniref:F-box domain-containing protein n=1 Tax=Favolaschia claudopus TaxID=2862362 RepID=A0AAV9ZW46_9AGAR